MTRLHRTLGRLVIAAAAAASVATSPPQDDWQLLASAPDVLGVVEDAAPQLIEAFHAELRDWGPGQVDGGLLRVQVTLRARTAGTTTATGRLVLQTGAAPGDTVGYALAPGETQRFDLDANVFGSCNTNPCTADVTLTIERDFQSGDPAVDVTIGGSVDATGAGHQSPDGMLRLSVVPVQR